MISRPAGEIVVLEVRARHEPACQDQIQRLIGVERRQKFARQHVGIDLVVAVQDENVIDAAVFEVGEAALEAAPVTVVAVIFLQRQKAGQRPPFKKSLDDRCRSVPAAIIDDEDFGDARQDHGRERAQDAPDRRFDVINRNDDSYFTRHRHLLPRST